MPVILVCTADDDKTGRGPESNDMTFLSYNSRNNLKTGYYRKLAYYTCSMHCVLDQALHQLLDRRVVCDTDLMCGWGCKRRVVGL